MNTYYYYCRCCCCRWWHLLLGLLVLRPSISSLLQSATSVITKCDSFFITKCDGLLLQSATAFILQSATRAITKCDRYYKVWQFYYKVRQVLQSATIITKCVSTDAARVTVTLYFSNRYFVRSSGDCFTKPKCTECFWKVSSISLRKNSVRQNGMRFESVLEYAIICLSHISDTVRASWWKLPTPPPKSSEKRQTC